MFEGQILSSIRDLLISIDSRGWKNGEVELKAESDLPCKGNQYGHLYYRGSHLADYFQLPIDEPVTLYDKSLTIIKVAHPGLRLPLYQATGYLHIDLKTPEGVRVKAEPRVKKREKTIYVEKQPTAPTLGQWLRELPESKESYYQIYSLGIQLDCLATDLSRDGWSNLSEAFVDCRVLSFNHPVTVYDVEINSFGVTPFLFNTHRLRKRKGEEVVAPTMLQYLLQMRVLYQPKSQAGSHLDAIKNINFEWPLRGYELTGYLQRAN